MRFLLPKHIKNCIETVEKAGYEAFCVGGAVRDMISRIKEPDDFDLAVSCPPEVTERLFPHTVPTGIKHGTITVLCDGIPVEVTTYRTDGGYKDSRHPESVTFVGDIREDLARRDFTVNAIAYNESVGVFDPFDGRGDLERRILRTVGNADRRFGEDALRIMRLYRFAAHLGFDVEATTGDSAEKNIKLLANVSAERILAELKKLLTGAFLLKGEKLFSCGGLSPFGIPKCDITPLSKLPQDFTLRLAGLLWVSGADTEAAVGALKLDNKTKKEVSALCEALKQTAPSDGISVKFFLSRYGKETFKSFIPLGEVFSGCDGGTLKKLLSLIEERDEPYTVERLAIGGSELVKRGLRGEEVGKTLEQLLVQVIKEPSLNTREKLLNLITK